MPHEQGLSVSFSSGPSGMVFFSWLISGGSLPPPHSRLRRAAVSPTDKPEKDESLSAVASENRQALFLVYGNARKEGLFSRSEANLSANLCGRDPALRVEAKRRFRPVEKRRGFFSHSPRGSIPIYVLFPQIP